MKREKQSLKRGVLIGILVLCYLIAFASSTAFAEVASEDIPVVLGQEERIVLSTPKNTQQIEVLAKIDTGADCSAIGVDVAQQLGIDLADAEKVLVKSALGEEWRPLVEVQIQLAGRTLTTWVTVSDRMDLTTRAIFGKNDLHGFVVDVSQDQLTSPYDTAIPPPDSVLPPQKPTIGNYPLLLMIPLATLVIMFFVYLSPKEIH
jgi:hypothetical protein